MNPMIQSTLSKLNQIIPLSENTKLNWLIKSFSALKIPLLLFSNPSVLELTDEKCVVEISLGYRTQNHLGVMYFGALAIGAELSIAAKAVQEISKSKKKIDFIFKDFEMKFLKRADGDVHFMTEQTALVKALIHEACQSGERLERTMMGYAIVPSKGPEKIAEYRLTLSVKQRS
ncbi:MAG: DUF4442 domain-containing protein [Pseudobdellovibrionaceae bacterium]